MKASRHVTTPNIVRLGLPFNADGVNRTLDWVESGHITASSSRHATVITTGYASQIVFSTNNWDC
jgi:hypothetical protein